MDDINHKHVCTLCKTEESKPHTWDAGVVTTPPTESTVGVKTSTCGDCGATKTDSIPIVSVSGLEALLNTGGEITLDQDYTDAGVTMSSGTATVNLNGHTILLTQALYVQAGATLTIKGTGSIITTGSHGIFNNGGTVTIEGGTIKAAQSPVYQGSGTLTITGGNLIREGTCQYVKQALMTNGGTITISGGIFDGGADGTALYIASTTEVSISAGTFLGADAGKTVIRKNADPGPLTNTGGTFAADISSYVNLETHTVTGPDENGHYTVSVKTTP